MNRTVTFQTWFNAYVYAKKAVANDSDYVNVRLKALQRNIVDEYAERLIPDITPEMLVQRFIKMNSCGISYIGQVAAWTQEMFDFCVKCREREDNPMDRIRFIPTVIPDPENDLTAETEAGTK